MQTQSTEIAAAVQAAYPLESQSATAETQPAQPTLLVSEIVVVLGHNPRTEFPEESILELMEQIRAVGGLLQPILVRYNKGVWELVAGERRLRAWKRLYGEESYIPVFIRSMTDEEGQAGAVIENIGHEAMTPLDEAEAAAKLLGTTNGDRAEAARRLGLKPSVFDARLALMYATTKVRAALRAKKICLGHAELLAACRKESQDAAVDQLVSSDKQMTIADLKAYIESVSLELGSAIFEKTQCAGCHHNSTNQGSLFAETIKEGRCTNKQCFDAKTAAEIDAKATSLKEEFAVVRIFRPGENMTVIALVPDGPKGVGQEQATACRVCKDYGAVISTVPDKMGRVYKGMCMNVACNTKHVAARQKADAKATSGQTTEPTKASANKPAATGQKSAATSVETAKTKVVASSEPSNQVKEYREKLWRLIFQRAIAELAVADNRMVLLALCLTNPSVINRSEIAASLESVMKVKTAYGPAELLADISNLKQEQLAMALNHIAASVNGSSGTLLAIKDVVGILKFYDIKISDHWEVGQPFFELLTKDVLDAVCEEIGIKTALGASYAKLRGGGKKEFVAAVSNVKDFDYRGRIPKILSY